MKIYLTSDNINGKTIDQQRMIDVSNKLKAHGYSSSSYLPVDPNTHITVLQDKAIPADALVVDIYGGACAGTIWEMGSSWYKSIRGKRKVMNIWIPPATNITNLQFLQKAHDDNFTPAYGKPGGFPDKVDGKEGLKRPDLFLAKNGYGFAYCRNTDEITAAILKQLPVIPKKEEISLQKGSKGATVETLQKWLNTHGFTDDKGNKLKVDGIFGDLTVQAVKHLQIKAHIVVDGVVGNQTQTVINNWNPVKPAPASADQQIYDAVKQLFPSHALKTADDLYNLALKFGVYLYYYNQRYTAMYSATVQAWHGGINCADWVNDIGMPILRVMGYAPEAWHCMVKCSDGKWYGHYVIKLNGALYDLSGAAAHGRPRGKGICLNGIQYMHQEKAGGIV